MGNVRPSGCRVRLVTHVDAQTLRLVSEVQCARLSRTTYKEPNATPPTTSTPSMRDIRRRREECLSSSIESAANGRLARIVHMSGWAAKSQQESRQEAERLEYGEGRMQRCSCVRLQAGSIMVVVGSGMPSRRGAKVREAMRVAVLRPARPSPSTKCSR